MLFWVPINNLSKDKKSQKSQKIICSEKCGSFTETILVSNCIRIVFVLPADITAYPFLQRICKPPGQLNTVRTRNICNRKTAFRSKYICKFKSNSSSRNNISFIYLYLMSFCKYDFRFLKYYRKMILCMKWETAIVLIQCRLPIRQFSASSRQILVFYEN